MNTRLKDICFAIISAYFFIALLAAPLFNWRYARQHGFGSWLFFGEIIATSKAAVWPYYVVSGLSHKFKSADSRNDQHYTNSKRACDEAMKTVITFGGTTELPPLKAHDVVQLLQASVSEAELVDDSYLQQVHPEFTRRYKDDYIASMRSLADAIPTGDKAKQISAVAGYNRFSDWVNAHAGELKFP